MRNVYGRIQRARTRVGKMYGSLANGAHGDVYLAAIRDFLAGESMETIEANLRRSGMDETYVRWCIDMAFGALEEDPTR